MAEQTTRLYAEEDVHELQLRAYEAGWRGLEGNNASLAARTNKVLPDPAVDDVPAAAAVEHLREDYTPRVPLTEEVLARSFVEALVAAAYLRGREDGEHEEPPPASWVFLTQDLIEAEAEERRAT